MNTKHISLAFAAAAALLAGCAKSHIEEVKLSDQFTDLELAYVGATETKAAIDGTDFPEEGEIGLFLFKDEQAETPYGESGYTNVKYAYNSTKGRWTASPSIKVGSTPGYLYGYYPYNSESTDVKEIPVVSSLNGNDVMYASQVKNVTDKTASQTAITMNHALARVSIKVINNGYTGDAKLSSIKFEDAKTSVSGTLDATTGAISGTTRADVTLIVPSDNQAITSDGTTYECLLVPSAVETNKQTVKITLTIDGNPKTATLSNNNGVIIAQNTKSNITINLSNSGLSVQTVSVDDWNVVEVGGHKVTVKRSNEDGIADDVFLDIASDGSTVTIKALASTGRFTKCTCTPDGKATCTPSIDATTGICTFTITDVQEDITAEVGYLKYNATVEYYSDMGAVGLNGVAIASGTPVPIYGGKEAVFTVEANTGCRFMKWTDGSGADVSTNNLYTISSVTSDITLKAIFEYEIAAVVKPVVAGKVTGAGTYPKGSDITLTLTYDGRASRANFIGWVNQAAPGDTIKTESININDITKATSITINDVSEAASYVAVFRYADALPGLFSVSATKKVIFSKGNLWCDGTGEGYTDAVPVVKSWDFEANQYDSNPTNSGDRVISHISHFMWVAERERSLMLELSGGTNLGLFTDGNSFDVGGVYTWRTLTIEEWSYLFSYDNSYNDTRRDRYKCGVTVCGKNNCVVLVPDDWNLVANPLETSYDATAWAEAQAAGAVCLPAAGWRDPDWKSVYAVGEVGSYWSGSFNNYDGTAWLLYTSEDVAPYTKGMALACSIRLVADY